MKKLAFVLLLVIAPLQLAFAVDFSTPITQLDGRPITDEKGVEVNATLGSVAELALLSVYQDETNDVVSGKIKADDFTKEKLRRYALAKKIREGGGRDVKLSAADILLLKALIGKNFSTLVAGQAIFLIEPEGN